MRKNVNKLLRADNRCVLVLVLSLAKITIFGMNSRLEAENSVLAQQSPNSCHQLEMEIPPYHIGRWCFFYC